ncbi:MAG TPA: LytTR family DNA-binding domain-containing protein [Bryobacteraceae bacterium]|jgi:two-component system LytT family response regulator|nr:LytTR family DNA-binding domain-containing protein [Bryobacteraceae bacterium]
MIRTVLVDDEPPASRKLRHLLSAEPDFEIVGEAESAAAAIEVLGRLQPDLVFLDIGLPDATGFDVVEALDRRRNMQIIFVTAYDDFALKAFEVHALDYLLKPVEPGRFSAAITRIRHFLKSGDTRELASRLDELVRSRNYVSRLLIDDNKRIFFLDVARIDWIESARNYACLHAGTQTHILRSTLEQLAAKLDPKIFRRISRSEIVNLRRIAEIHPWTHGDARLRLADDTELTWSRRYRPASFEELEKV